MELVNQFGRERYRHGKSVVRGEKGPSYRSRVKQGAKAKAHAEAAASLRSRIEQMIEREINPYRGPG